MGCVRVCARACAPDAEKKHRYSNWYWNRHTQMVQAQAHQTDRGTRPQTHDKSMQTIKGCIHRKIIFTIKRRGGGDHRHRKALQTHKIATYRCTGKGTGEMAHIQSAYVKTKRTNKRNGIRKNTEQNQEMVQEKGTARTGSATKVAAVQKGDRVLAHFSVSQHMTLNTPNTEHRTPPGHLLRNFVY